MFRGLRENLLLRESQNGHKSRTFGQCPSISHTNLRHVIVNVEGKLYAVETYTHGKYKITQKASYSSEFLIQICV